MSLLEQSVAHKCEIRAVIRALHRLCSQRNVCVYQVTVADRQRYEKVVSNFERLLELLSQPKRQRRAPFDGTKIRVLLY